MTNEAKKIDVLDLESMIEALIFSCKEPVSLEKIIEVLKAGMEDLPVKEIKSALTSLWQKWNDEERALGRGLSLKKIADGFVFTSASQHGEIVQRIVEAKPITLTKAQIEVLAIVAYRQPLTRIDVDEIRGVDSSFALKRLMQLKLLKILGKSEGLGRPILYGTTKEFLEFFSLNSLNDLPTLKQYEALGKNEEEEVDVDMAKVTFKDIFADANEAIFSSDLEQMSNEALESLEEALLRVDILKKVHADKK